MATIVKLRPLVITDLEDNFSWIAKDNQEAAERFKLNARRDFHRLALMPEMGPRHQIKHPRLRNLRFWCPLNEPLERREPAVSDGQHGTRRGGRSRQSPIEL